MGTTLEDFNLICCDSSILSTYKNVKSRIFGDFGDTK